MPSVAAAEDSFTKRVAVATDAKVRLAQAAFALLTGHETVFLDSSSTAFADKAFLSVTGVTASGTLSAISLVLADGLRAEDAARLSTDGAVLRLVGSGRFRRP